MTADLMPDELEVIRLIRGVKQNDKGYGELRLIVKERKVDLVQEIRNHKI